MGKLGDALEDLSQRRERKWNKEKPIWPLSAKQATVGSSFAGAILSDRGAW
jgi:hypothetical protein